MTPCCLTAIQEYQKGDWVQIWAAELGEGLDSRLDQGVTTHKGGTPASS